MQIVNDRDVVIGVKERKDINPKIDIFRAPTLWVTNSKGQTLLACRALNKG